MARFLDAVVERFVRRKRVWRYRSSVTGRYVSKAFAERYPKLTVREEA